MSDRPYLFRQATHLATHFEDRALQPVGDILVRQMLQFLFNDDDLVFEHLGFGDDGANSQAEALVLILMLLLDLLETLVIALRTPVEDRVEQRGCGDSDRNPWRPDVQFGHVLLPLRKALALPHLAISRCVDVVVGLAERDGVFADQAPRVGLVWYDGVIDVCRQALARG